MKQSIYRFRLADPGIFLKKYREFVPAEEANPGQGRKILLSENFRSGGEILEAANHVFRCTMSTSVGGLEYGEAEALREGVPHLPLPQCPVEFHGIQLTPGPGERRQSSMRLRPSLWRSGLISSSGSLP